MISPSKQQIINVAAAVIRLNNKILITSRPHGKSYAGFWEFPGGKIHEGETPQHCIKRELKEELNSDSIPLDIISCNFFDYPEKKVKIYFVRTFLLDEKQLSPEENQKISWIDKENLSNIQILPADKIFINIYLCNNMQNYALL
ncbi:MAG TPA: (deoxy)nucleoside triphosphate pyrophosphohydrolase [Victivallales bacterium]|nr:(deoxy)nucleoside triphosphate pyrophosphohydrolase [Victivallales bacterium]HPO89840.1 (deoxy)nucleoside triphosphate pyrophosphohydrolase [Victivallales bacterium]HRR27859.1 (deoxy)nucleoside triphosphate pyrophosphohydrolase [Victivallales bacterium]HRU00344.1 (deoxy)nucleoside triphosphate pyrophosphohydrolase [Victivallales bacterium]